MNPEEAKVAGDELFRSAEMRLGNDSGEAPTLDELVTRGSFIMEQEVEAYEKLITIAEGINNLNETNDTQRKILKKHIIKFLQDGARKKAENLIRASGFKTTESDFIKSEEFQTAFLHGLSIAVVRGVLSGLDFIDEFNIPHEIFRDSEFVECAKQGLREFVKVTMDESRPMLFTTTEHAHLLSRLCGLGDFFKELTEIKD